MLASNKYIRPNWLSSEPYMQDFSGAPLPITPEGVGRMGPDAGGHPRQVLVVGFSTVVIDVFIIRLFNLVLNLAYEHSSGEA